MMRADTDCPFCPIVYRGRTDDGRELPFRTPYSVGFEPLNPVTPGHVLIVPRLHVTDFVADGRVFAITAQDAQNYVAMIADRADGWNVITSMGEAATQSVFHLHLHVVPRRHGDGLHLPWTPS